MFNFNLVFVATLIVSLAVVSCKTDAIEVTDVEKNVADTNPAEVAVLTQLKFSEADSGDAIYTYKCTVGTYRSNRLACTAQDSNSWNSLQNVQLKLRCPRSGSGLTLSYVEIIYSVSSASVNCYVNEGAIGLGYIGVTINAWNTLIFNYSAKFYSY
ncbi:uncharacterized protein LOC135953981 [Calliphora vicina]|uniref:uncharacterized protein LOC135953981 n=1 Tax=Calliphora vicina TaxID=7373 RepID=UPI00325AC9DA